MTTIYGQRIVDILGASTPKFYLESIQHTGDTTMTLYEYAVLLDPTGTDDDNGVTPELIDGPTAVVAASEEQVRMIAARSLSEDVALDRVRVLVRPFA